MMFANSNSNQNSMPTATELATLKPAADVKAFENTQKDERSSASGPSRQTVNTIYNIARGANKIHQIVHPSSADFDDDDQDIVDDDDDDDNDDDNDNDDEADADDDIDEMRHGDEPMTDHDDIEAPKPYTSPAHHTTNPDNIAAMVAAGVARDTRDPNAVRYRISPEKIDGSRTPATSKASAGGKQNEAQPNLLSATHNDKTTKFASVPETKSTISTKGQIQLESKPSASMPSSSTVEPSTSVPAPVSDPTPVPAKSKADPLAPTAAAPYGYKIVTVKKPDGTIGKVKRPLKEGEKPPTLAAQIPAPAKKPADSKKIANSEKTSPTKSPTTVHKTAPTEKQTPAPRKVTPANANASPDAKSNGKSVFPTSSTSVASGGEFKDIEEAPLLLESSKKPLDSVKVTVTELDQGIASQAAAPSTDDEPSKGTHKLAKVTKVLIWIVCILFPLCFLALGITTVAMNLKRVPVAKSSDSDDTASYPNHASEKKDLLSQMITIAASVWPIVFAAIVAQTLKMYAAYRVERGIRLVMLEQLISSHSVGGAIKQPFMLRTFNWTTLLLFFIWCLSPLAGQAILRMSTIIETHDTMNTTVSYFSAQTFDPSGSGDNPWSRSSDSDSDSYPLRRSSAEIPKAITLALLQGYHQTQDSSQDIYRNVRIPAAENTTVVSDPDAYLPYTSLLGYPFWIKDQNNSEQITWFNLTSSYFSFNCSNLTRIDPYGPVLPSHNMTYYNQNLIFAAANNTSNSYSGRVYTNSSIVHSNTSQDHHFVNVSYMEPGPRGTLYLASTLLDLTQDVDEDMTTYFSECSYHNVMVKSSVYCESTELNATCDAWKSVQNSNLSPTMSLGYWFPYILQWVANDELGISDIQYFLLDPSFASRRNETSQILGLDLAKITSAQLSERLNIVVNTLWSIYLNKMAFIATGQSAWFDGTIAIASTPAKATKQNYKMYVVFFEWATVLIVCSVILLTASVAAIIWETRVIGPDFLGFANTAIKKSVKMPKSMSMLDARDRLEALHECEVLLQDVKPENAVGKIALGVKEDSSTMLVSGRRYR